MGKGNDATATSGKEIFYWLKTMYSYFFWDAWVKKKQGE